MKATKHLDPHSKTMQLCFEQKERVLAIFKKNQWDERKKNIFKLLQIIIYHQRMYIIIYVYMCMCMCILKIYMENRCINVQCSVIIIICILILYICIFDFCFDLLIVKSHTCMQSKEWIVGRGSACGYAHEFNDSD